MNTRGLFVTGTDTGVGKTWIGVQIAHQLCARGLPVAPRKTVESGCQERDGELVPADGEAYYRAVNARQSLAQITAYRLRHSISPQRAARIEQVDTTLANLVAATCDAVDTATFLLVEGAGGFYSPLALDGLNADFAERLQLPVLLVAPDRLGVINHVLLSVEAIANRGLHTLAVVLNRLDDSNTLPPGMDNLSDLQSLPCPVYLMLRDELLTADHALVHDLIARARREDPHP
ncbi:MAG: dethiobiotin synthase [Gammaproteobacteria bacterium]|nr:dethiobiotin synthase [Gammaproteobacteria bacterium]